MSGVYKNFKKYAKHGVVPAKARDGEKVPNDSGETLYFVTIQPKELVPQNSFYKSVHYVDSVVGPGKDVIFGVERKNYYSNYIGCRTNDTFPVCGLAILALTNIVLQPLYLVLAYLSYWPAKGLSKVTDKFDLKDNTESLIGYSNMFSNKAGKHSGKIAEFVNGVLNYVCTAIIWVAALLVTPLVWIVDKVASKFSKVEEPEAHESRDNERLYNN